MLLRLAAAALLALVVSPPAAEGRLRLTHRVTVSGALTDEWTVNAQEACSPVGSGKLTLDFKTSPSRAGLVNPNKRGRGRWMLEIPTPGFGNDMRDLPATGYSTRTDDTQPQPPPSPPACDPLEKTGCGTQALRNLKVTITGVDRRRLGQLGIWPLQFQGDCFRGELDTWRQPRGLVGRELFFPMPSQATLARQRVTVIHASSRKRFVSANLTETVVRRATVTLTRR